MDPSRTVNDRRTSPDSVCTACGCFCDDIVLHLEGNRIAEARGACSIGEAHFLGERRVDGPGSWIQGEPVTFENAVERAAAILAGASCPLVIGLKECTTEGHRASVELAESIGGCLDVPGTAATIASLQSVGEVTCTLGEIQNRADFVLVWRADPVQTHPRLFSRHVLEPRGDFLPGGRNDRYLAVVDIRETTTFAEADRAIRIEEGAEVEAIWVLRALLKGIAIEGEKRAGVALRDWQGLVERLREARYGAIFYDAGLDGLSVRGIHSLVRELNDWTRFVVMPLGPRGNVVGARNVLTWRTGFPGAVRFVEGHRPLASDARLPRESAVDAVLVVSGDPMETDNEPTREGVRKVPRIVLTGNQEPDPQAADVVIRTAAFGIETSGTVYRMDGVPLPLRAAVASRFPTVEVTLRTIAHRVRERRA